MKETVDETVHMERFADADVSCEANLCRSDTLDVELKNKKIESQICWNSAKHGGV